MPAVFSAPSRSRPVIWRWPPGTEFERCHPAASYAVSIVICLRRLGVLMPRTGLYYPSWGIDNATFIMNGLLLSRLFWSQWSVTSVMTSVV